jgi:hypothetical protein
MILNFLGELPVVLNEKPYYGWVGLLLPLVYLPMLSAVGAFFNAIFFSAGNRVYKLVRKER